MVIYEYTFTYLTGKHRRNHKSNCRKVSSRPSMLFTNICRRINKLDIDINNSIDDDVVIIIAADMYRYQDYKQRSRWMQDKWNVKDKKGYLKIHVAVNIKTKEILALKVTDEKRCMMERL